MSFIRSLKIDKTKLDVEVTIGVQWPELVDIQKVEKLAADRPHHREGREGGLDVPDPENNDPAVIASAAIAVRIDVP